MPGQGTCAMSDKRVTLQSEASQLFIAIVTTSSEVFAPSCPNTWPANTDI